MIAAEAALGKIELTDLEIKMIDLQQELSF